MKERDRHAASGKAVGGCEAVPADAISPCPNPKGDEEAVASSLAVTIATDAISPCLGPKGEEEEEAGIPAVVAAKMESNGEEKERRSDSLSNLCCLSAISPLYSYVVCCD